MKKTAVFVLAMTLISLGVLHSESMDEVRIVRENTGSVSTLKEVENPNVSPGDVIHVHLAVDEVTAKWNEGYVQWKYEYENSDGETIWSSDFDAYKEYVSGKSWDFSRVVDITIPKNISKGDYRLGFTLIDYHTQNEYRGWTDFTVGASAPAASKTDNDPPPAKEPAAGPADESGKYSVWIEDVELKLTAVEKNSNRLTFSFTGKNHGDEDLNLRVYSYTTRFIDGNGKEYTFNDVDGGGSLSQSVTFPPGIPMQADVYFRKPATNADDVALLYIEFYYIDDVLELRSIPIPWP